MWSKSIKIYQNLLELNPQTVAPAEVMLKIADAYYNQKDYRSALDYYRQGQQKFMEIPWAKNFHYGMILCLYKTKQIDLAKKELEVFAQKYPEPYLIEKLRQKLP